MLGTSNHICPPKAIGSPATEAKALEAPGLKRDPMNLIRNALKSATKYTFRRAHPSDYQGINRVQKLCFPSEREHTDKDVFEMGQLNGSEFHKFVIVQENARGSGEDDIAAYIMYQLHEELGAHIVSLATSPYHQKQGHARDLMRFSLRHAESWGCPKSSLRVRSSNEAAIRLYRSLGFSEAKREIAYYWDPVEDA
ncbi:hypothetical protein AAMO2058_000563600 [Amorphochlora amoebiformis]